MKHLVLLVHADPRVTERYVLSLRARLSEPFDFAVVNSVHGQRSSAYRALYAELKGRRSGATINAVCEHARVRPPEAYDSVTIASFSAGYALVQSLLAEPASYEKIHGVVAIDSWHTGLEADGTANDSQLAGLVRFGLSAAESDRVCWLAHTDVRTPQKGPEAFASTTQVASEVRRLCGLPMLGEDVGRGGLRVKAYDLHKRDHDEHVAALSDWGDEWLADAVATLIDRRESLREAIDTEIPPPLDLQPLGVRALGVAESEQAAGVKEIAGPKHHPRILEYFSRCERDGRNIGSWLTTDETAWCAAAASFCAFEAARPGEAVPHRYRASVRELWADAIESGAARSAAMTRRGEYTPKPGDLAIMTRGGPAFGSGASAFARTNGLGHVGRIVSYGSDIYQTVDGNVGNQWSLVTRKIAAPELVGLIAYPDAEKRAATDEELEGLAILDSMERAFEAIAKPMRRVLGWF